MFKAPSPFSRIVYRSLHFHKTLQVRVSETAFSRTSLTKAFEVFPSFMALLTGRLWRSTSKLSMSRDEQSYPFTLAAGTYNYLVDYYRAIVYHSATSGLIKGS